MTTVKATEHDVQTALFEYAALRANQDPAWGLLFSIPNGQYRPGQRMEAGLRAGVADICAPIPRGRYHGAFIELKVGTNKTTEAQAEFLTDVARQGYFTAVCYGFEEARDTLESYLGMGRRAVEVSND